MVEGIAAVEQPSARSSRRTPRRCGRRTPGAEGRRAERLTSRFVSPVDVAPHVAGAAVDLTLVDVCGEELDLGTPIDATPEESDGRC